MRRGATRPRRAGPFAAPSSIRRSPAPAVTAAAAVRGGFNCDRKSSGMQMCVRAHPRPQRRHGRRADPPLPVLCGTRAEGVRERGARGLEGRGPASLTPTGRGAAV